MEDKEDAIVDAYAEAIVDRIGPVLINPALKKYGDTLHSDIYQVEGGKPREEGTCRPDFRVKEPNLRASTDIDCSISSVWYDCRNRILTERLGYLAANVIEGTDKTENGRSSNPDLDR